MSKRARITVSRPASNAAPANPSRVDFGYAFGTPHRMTLALPDSSDKTLCDLQAGSLRLAWTYDDLKRFPLCAFVTPQTQWEVRVQPEIDGQPFAQSAGRGWTAGCRCW